MTKLASVLIVAGLLCNSALGSQTLVSGTVLTDYPGITNGQCPYLSRLHPGDSDKPDTQAAKPNEKAPQAKDKRSDKERYQKKYRSAMIAMTHCTITAIEQIDDGVSDPKTVAVAAGQRCYKQLQAWGRYLCLSHNLQGYCSGIVNNVTSIHGSEKLLVPQVIEHRRKKALKDAGEHAGDLIPLIEPVREKHHMGEKI